MTNYNYLVKPERLFKNYANISVISLIIWLRI